MSDISWNEQPRSIRPLGQWTVYEWDEAGSTNDFARCLPPWHIARCDYQSNGRGRFNRTWFGACGGLWVSFTLPLPDTATHPGIHCEQLPLVAGLALLDTLEFFGIFEARLRWPNDLLLHQAKLAGILVERPRPDMAIVGIGLNISNDMGKLDGKVKEPPTRLADWISPCPSIDEVMEQVSTNLKAEWQGFINTGLSGLLPRLNSSWGGKRPVVVQTDDRTLAGVFLGIDELGAPILEFSDGLVRTIPAHSVTRLTES